MAQFLNVIYLCWFAKTLAICSLSAYHNTIQELHTIVGVCVGVCVDMCVGVCVCSAVSSLVTCYMYDTLYDVSLSPSVQHC